MSKSPAELAVQVRVTKAFIDSDPTDVVLHRLRPATRTPSGGTQKATTAPLTVQRVKLIDQSAGTNPASIGERTVDGTESVQTGMILGLPTLDISEGDTFDVGQFHYVVVTLYPDNGYERRAMTERHNPRKT